MASKSSCFLLSLRRGAHPALHRGLGINKMNVGSSRIVAESAENGQVA